MYNSSWELDHIGIAVGDLREGISRYGSMPGSRLVLEESIEEQGVDVAFLNTGGTLLELLAARSGDGPLGRFLQKRGEGLHHLCYRVASLSEELQRLTEQGVRLIDKVPRRGSRDMQIAFIHPEVFAGVLIELCSPVEKKPLMGVEK